MNNVVVGSGAQVLGNITVGEYGRVGANAVVVKDVGANETVVGIPARVVGVQNQGTFRAYATNTKEVDPLIVEIETLKAEIAKLKKGSNKKAVAKKSSVKKTKTSKAKKK